MKIFANKNPNLVEWSVYALFAAGARENAITSKISIRRQSHVTMDGNIIGQDLLILLNAS